MIRQKSFYLSVCSLLALCTASFLNANTIIVDNTGATPGSFLTIKAAVDVSSTGTIILLTAGQTFTGADNQNIDIDPSHIGLDLTFGRTGDGADPIIDMQTSGQLFIIESTATVAINNLFIAMDRGDRRRSDN